MNALRRLKPIAMANFIMATVWLTVCIEWGTISMPFMKMQQSLANEAAELHQNVLSRNEGNDATKTRPKAETMVTGLGVVANAAGSFVTGIGGVFAGIVASVAGLIAAVFLYAGILTAKGKPGSQTFVMVLAWTALVFSIPWAILMVVGFSFANLPTKIGLHGLWNTVVLLSGIPYFLVCRKRQQPENRPGHLEP